MRGVGNMLLSRDREMGKAVTGFESRTVTAHEVSNSIVNARESILSVIFRRFIVLQTVNKV